MVLFNPKGSMKRGLFDRVAVEDMDDAYIARLRRLRWASWVLCAVVFSAILLLELQSRFQASFIYLFILPLIMLAVLFSSDAVSTKIDMYESEKIWRAPKESEESIRS